jgi:hypothetical protein
MTLILVMEVNPQIKEKTERNTPAMREIQRRIGKNHSLFLIQKFPHASVCCRDPHPGCVQRLTPAIPTTHEAEIRNIMTQGQPGKKVSQTPSQQTS